MIRSRNKNVKTFFWNIVVNHVFLKFIAFLKKTARHTMAYRSAIFQ